MFWQELFVNIDLLFYEGLYGGVKIEDIDVVKYVDLLVGMVFIVNLEWIQKIVWDIIDCGYLCEVVMSSIV